LLSQAEIFNLFSYCIHPVCTVLLIKALPRSGMVWLCECHLRAG
jgi:hypothetical protein